MGSTKPWQRAATRAPVPLPDDFDELRYAFFERLQFERVHFVSLSAALARADENSARIFDDLAFSARGLHGRAAELQFTDVAVAASSLERAATRALMSSAENSDPSVWTALVLLVTLMGALGGNETSNFGTA